MAVSTGGFNPPPMILVIDDEAFFRRQFAEILDRLGFRIMAVASGQDVSEIISGYDFAAVICDIELPEISGTEVLKSIRRFHPEIPVIMVSGHQQFSIAREVIREGAIDYLVKPLQEDELVAALDRAIEGRRRSLAAKLAEQEARRRLSDLVLLKEIGEAASTGGDPQRLFDQILDSITTSLHVETTSLMLCDEEGFLRIRAGRGLPQTVPDDIRIAPGEGISGHVLASGRPALVADISRDSRFSISEFSEHYQTRSLLSVPLRVRDSVIGVLNVNNKSSGETFNAEDQNLLSTIAHQAALAIENFRLVSRLKVQARELEEANHRLRRLNQTRSNLICNLSHELNTPLTCILGYVELILNFPERLEEGELQEHLTKVYREGLRMERIVSGMLRLFSLDSGDENWEFQPLSLRTLLTASLEKFTEIVEEKSLRVEFELAENLPRIYGDMEKMGLLFDALIDNAIKFNCIGGTIRLEGSRHTENKTDYIRLKIHNDGLSIPPEADPDIFDRFTQLGNLDTDKPAGVGIGLAICKLIIEAMKGTIRLESPQGKGTTFCLLLPTRETYGETHA